MNNKLKIKYSLFTIFAIYNANVSADWQYHISEDKMSGAKSYFARVVSENSVNLDFPYDGETKATITIRKGSRSEYSNSVRNIIAITIDNGQLLCLKRQCVSRIKFDNQIEKFILRSPSDGSTNTLGIFEVAQFTSKLKKSKQLLLELEIYKGGKHIFEFDTSNFVWKHH